MDLLENLAWRYATKKFHGDPVSPDHISMIADAIRLAPSSASVQPYHIVVAAGELKDKLITSSGQLDKLSCSHLFVFLHAHRLSCSRRHAGSHRGRSARKDAGRSCGLCRIDRAIDKNSPEELKEWAARQAYIALGIGVVACAEMRIDACPMEGFKPDEFHSILGLPEYIQPAVIMAVGHRDPNDPAQPSMRKKVRFPKEDLFEFRSQ